MFFSSCIIWVQIPYLWRNTKILLQMHTHVIIFNSLTDSLAAWRHNYVHDCKYLRVYFLFLNFFFFFFYCAGSSLLSRLLSSCGKQDVLSSCNTWAYCWDVFCCGSGVQASVVVASRLQSTGSIPVVQRLSCPAACGIFPDKNQTRVSCFGRWILYHWAIRKPWSVFSFLWSSFIYFLWVVCLGSRL